MKTIRLLLGCALLAAVPLGIVVADEMTLSEDQLRKLDTLEEYALSKAEYAFSQEEYAKARDAYGGFAKKFAESRLVPYVLFKKARCSHLAGEHTQAIEDYNETIKGFPKQLDYVVPAMYHIGECHAANGDADKNVETWAAIANNEQYNKHPVAAPLISKLAEMLLKQGKKDEALKYYGQIAQAFRDSDKEKSHEAMEVIIRQLVRTSPDEAKLREFYKEMKTFEDTPQAVPDNLDEDKVYWTRVLEYMWKNGEFSWSEREQRKEYFDYWIGVMENKFPEWDDFQIDLATARYRADRDREKWTARLDEQFQKRHKKGDWARVLKWVKVYKNQWSKIREYAVKVDYESSGVEGISQLMNLLCNELQHRYLAKEAFRKYCESLDYDKLSAEDIHKLMLMVCDTVQDRKAAKTLLEKMKFEGMSDEKKLELAGKLAELDEDLTKEVYAHLEDTNRAKAELLAYYARNHDLTKGLPLAEELAKVEEYAKDALWSKAELLEWDKQYAKAIDAFKAAGKSPEGLWRIVDCLLGQDDTAKAMAQLREIESRFKDQAAKAAMRIAHLHRDADAKKEYIAALRSLVEKYPGSPEAATAGTELKEAGEKVITPVVKPKQEEEDILELDL